MRDEVSKRVQQQFQLDVIEPIMASECVSPIMVARKKDGIAVRAFNKAVIPDIFPLSCTEELLNSTAGAKRFSKSTLRLLITSCLCTKTVGILQLS